MPIPTQRQTFATRYGPCAVLCAITLVAFSPVFSLDFIRYDDTLYVTDNPGVKMGFSPQGLRYAATAIVSGNYHPMTVLSHQLDVTLFGLRPAGHHTVNLLFHLANAFLLFHLLSTITGAPRRSLLVAALFAVHPQHVESVAWVSERKDVLSTFFMFLAMGAYVSFVRKGRRSAYLRVIVCYALALLAKPMPVTLPFLLLMLDYWPLRRTNDGGLREYARELPALTMEKWPLFALSAASCVITYIVQSASGATRNLDAVSLADRCANATMAYATYLWKMAVPAGLAPHYPLVAVSAPRAAAYFAVLAGVTIVALALFRRRPYLFVGWFWYVGMLVPVIGFVQVGSQAMADRYTYATTIGITVALVWRVADALGTKRSLRVPAFAAAALLLALLCGLTFSQTRRWQNTQTLFTYTLTVAPQSAVAHKVLGLDYAKKGDYTEALDRFTRAHELNPRDRDSAFNLGTALVKLGRPDDAIPWLTIAIATYDKPADAYATLGWALLQKNMTADAKAQFEKALELNPDQIDARINLGVAEGMLGNTQHAIDTLAEAVRRAPDNPDARYNYGVALINAGRAEEAAKQFEEAIRLQPEFPDADAFLEQARAAANR